MAHLSPSTIFSPSVARQHLATAKDWNHIDAWLTKKYHPKAAPPIERTPETLKALLTLSSLNESSDEERELLHQSTLRAISNLSQSLQQQSSSSNAEILETISENLTREGTIALDSLSTLNLLLNPPDDEVASLAQKIISLQIEEFDIEQAISRISTMHQYLSTEKAQITNTTNQLQTTPFLPSDSLTQQTQEYTRKAKTLATKLPELQKQIMNSEKKISDTTSNNSSRSDLGLPGRGGGGDDRTSYPTIQEIIEEERTFRELMRELRGLEGQVKSFCGLPQDTDLARLEVEGLRVELRELVGRRDALFEGLVERETPRKGR